MYLFCNGVICLVLSLLVVYGLNRLSLQSAFNWVRPKKNYVGAVFLSVVFFFFISIIALCIFYYFISYKYKSDLLVLFKESGIILAVSILVTGLLCRSIYNIIQKMTNKHIEDGLYPLEYSDVKWFFVFSCLVMMIIFFKVGEYKSGLTFLAIIIGKFVWFDMEPKQKQQKLPEMQEQQNQGAIDSLEKVPLLYWAVLFYLLLIVIYACFFENLMAGCIIGILLSWLICFICDILHHRNV